MNIKGILLTLIVFLASFPASGASEPMVDFNHRYAKFNVSMKLSKVKKLEKYLPDKLRREIGDEYYPEIRQGLAASDTLRFKDGNFRLYNEEDGKIRLTMTFRVFVLTLRNLTWADLDDIYENYFAPGTEKGKKTAPLPKRLTPPSGNDIELIPDET